MPQGFLLPSMRLDHIDVVFCALLHHLFRPEAGLHLSDVSLAKKVHA